MLLRVGIAHGHLLWHMPRYMLGGGRVGGEGGGRRSSREASGACVCLARSILRITQCCQAHGCQIRCRCWKLPRRLCLILVTDAVKNVAACTDASHVIANFIAVHTCCHVNCSRQTFCEPGGCTACCYVRKPWSLLELEGFNNM